jgi:hypothetical protein
MRKTEDGKSMAYGDEILAAFKELLDRNPDEPALPIAFVNQMLETREREARESERNKEREELVCRLLASGIPVEELSLILKIRKDEITMIEQNNADEKIPEYAAKLKARRKGRERAAERRREMDELLAKRQA